LKLPSQSWFGSLRDRLVFTPEERRVFAFVLAAVALGVATKHHRDTHPAGTLPTTEKQRGAYSLTASPSSSPPRKKSRKRADRAPRLPAASGPEEKK
jgi:hypothetical protein